MRGGGLVLLTLRVHCLMSHSSGRRGNGIVSVKSSLSYGAFKWEEEGWYCQRLEFIVL